MTGQQTSIIHMNRRFVPVAVTLLAAFLSAVAIAALLPFSPRRPSLSRVPSYRLELSGTHAPDTPGDHLIARSDEQLSLVLRPMGIAEGELEVEALIEHAGEVRPWPVRLERYPQGTFAMRAPIAELPIVGRRPDRFKLTFLIGRPWALPRGAAAANARSFGADWCIVSGELTVGAVP